MGGVTDLQELLGRLDPVRRPGVYLFCVLPDSELPTGVDPIAMVREEEGLTLVVELSEAQRYALSGGFPCGCITLKVHSDLAAVGLTAAVSAALTEAGIPCNVIAGFYHDHLFVPVEESDRAMQLLRTLSAGAAKS